MLSLSDPGDLFRSYSELHDTNGKEAKNDWERLYSGKAIHAYNHRFASFVGGDWRHTTQPELTDAGFEIATEYFARRTAVQQRLATKAGHWLLGYRDIARSTDERTLIAAAIPRVGCDTTCRNVYVSPLFHHLTACLLANFNSLVLDYFVRQKVIGTHLGAGTFEQVPVIPPLLYREVDVVFILRRVLELTFTSWDIQAFALNCGYKGTPFRWDGIRRFLLTAEIDAMYFRLYQIDRVDADYILDTFPIIRRRDEQLFDEYRTKRVILEIYDAMAEAERTGVPYQTRLDPPPGDPRAAHPVTEP